MESAATRLPRSVSYASTKSASLSNHSSEIPFLDLSIVSSLSCSRAYLPLPSMVLVAAGKPRRLVASLRRSYASIESWRRGRFVDAAGIVRKTARRHDDLLAMLFVAEEVPACIRTGSIVSLGRRSDISPSLRSSGPCWESMNEP